MLGRERKNGLVFPGILQFPVISSFLRLTEKVLNSLCISVIE